MEFINQYNDLNNECNDLIDNKVNLKEVFITG